jgi:hypothetical protein
MTVRKIPHRNIALVLAAALLSVSAATAQSAPRLPNAVFGHHWCFSKYYPNQIFQSDDFDSCANRGGVRFWRRGGKSGYQLGRFNVRTDCAINKIDLVRQKVYRVHSSCKRQRLEEDPDEHEPWREKFELWQSKTGMHWRELEEDRK